MILGLGTDLCSVARITRLFERFGARFLRRVFTDEEVRRAEGKRFDKSRFCKSLALSFAAKEAASKALGTGLRRLGTGGAEQAVFWRDIEVGRLESGKPTLRLHRQAHRIVCSRVAENSRACAELSLSVEEGMAHAIVLIYACGARGGQRE